MEESPLKIIPFKNIKDLQERIWEIGLDQYIILKLDERKVTLDENYFSRMEEVASASDASITYCHYREEDEYKIYNHPVIDYQFGSIRDDFDFGALVMLNTADVLAGIDDLKKDEYLSPDGGWYALRLRMSIGKTIAAVPEYLYTVEKIDSRKSGEKQHDYLKKSRRYYQAEMERICTDYLADIGGLITNETIKTDITDDPTFLKVSVIIPVKNRTATILDALNSALAQKCDFKFNVIVVDNASTDGTAEKLAAVKDERVKLIKVEEKENLNIGGCWNKAINSPDCGDIIVQLDSDDLYKDETTLSKIVNKFCVEKSAMVIGSYELVDFNLNPLPPGVISHLEWSDLNGANNALRINGLGAPRAFLKSALPANPFPNVSYGEDYAVGLRMCREYKISRIYEPIYLCRRWGGNSDADLDIYKVNEHNEYKDFIRSVELIARIRMNTDNKI